MPTTPPRTLPRSSWFAACAFTLLGVLLLWPSFDEPRIAAQGGADPALDDLEENRQRLEGIRAKDPEHYARLRHDLRQFLSLPADRQAHLRQIDREVNEEGSSTAFRLLQALAQYVDWLDRRSPAERQELERAPRDKRIALIRKMREDEWIQRLPLALREQISKAEAKDRPAVVARIRHEERERRARWRVAIRHWDQAVISNASLPLRLEDLPQPNMRAFVKDTLIPMLSEEEKKRLSDAEGHWPDYPRTLVELADKHPVLLPGPLTGPRTFDALPKELQSRLPQQLRKNPPPSVKDAEGKWPDYLIAIAEYLEKNKGKKGKVALPPKLCPSRPGDFIPAIGNFIDKRLFPRLTTEEQRRLVEAEGQWPLYPRTVLELARKKGLEVPGMALPGPRGWWDKYRTSAVPDPGARPVLPDQLLKSFVLHELTPEERARLRLSSADPLSRSRAEEAFVRRKPEEWQRQQRLDEEKFLRKYGLTGAAPAGRVSE